jgi:hypothetical protein
MGLAVKISKKHPKNDLKEAGFTLKTTNSAGSGPVFIRISGFGDNPVKYTDPDGEIAEVSVDGDNVTIIIPVEYKKGTTEQQKTEFRESAEKYWSGQFGDKNVKLHVVETNAGKRNRIGLFRIKRVHHTFYLEIE